MAIKIINCFQDTLPRIPSSELTEQQEDLKAQPPSNATKNTPLPKLAVEKDVTPYLQISRAFLDSPQTTTSLELNDEYVAPNDAVWEMHNEADVVRYADRYLVQPVLAALNVRLGAKILANSEAKYEKLQTVMLIEFKRRGIIKPEEFSDAVMCTEEKYEEKLARLSKGTDKTVFTRGMNIIWLIKQAYAYVKRSKCNYAALCDYDNLILLKFHRMPRSADVIVVPQEHFREALLGFMVESCEEAEL